MATLINEPFAAIKIETGQNSRAGVYQAILMQQCVNYEKVFWFTEFKLTVTANHKLDFGAPYFDDIKDTFSIM